MFNRITATPKAYAWGSTTAIPQLLGVAPDGSPQAELWMGAHPDSTTYILDPYAGQPATLNEWIATQPEAALGKGTRLPFLFKILAAAKPLSLQAHPSLDLAREGYAEENRRGVPRDAPDRNYKDEWHKPELIVALSDGFQALCGFRAIDQSLKLLQHLADLADARPSILIEGFRDQLEEAGLEETVRDVLTRQPAGLVRALVDASRSNTSQVWAAETQLLLNLDECYPGDRGIAIAALLNFVTLKKNQALFLPAGNIHAYVAGVGVEIMAASDNVVRGGLTSKNIDVPELLRVLDFRPTPVPYVQSVTRVDGFVEYPVPVFDFQLLRADADTTINFISRESAVVFATTGPTTVTQGTDVWVLKQGEAAYIAPGPVPFLIESEGDAFIATS
ncbi:mannose-6-phosphate isomerase, class I [Cryobacterium zongtaii]|uniref:mannose-6-phosphate isomerase n=1 Tax=Cryobacterium zongtaii TaxID=1259217 RepID=A0A2S3ZDS5_9MICO|nr:mannose-6-phosphate isomerase, class I [Cryobacterium zongtaii]POH64667.1 mannose-6-phosphate isomerase, class I [Cryobacterium zongtaii]